VIPIYKIGPYVMGSFLDSWIFLGEGGKTLLDSLPVGINIYYNPERFIAFKALGANMWMV
jgi:hypothetical protein